MEALFPEYSLAAEGLAKDPRVQEAKKLLREALESHRRLLNGVKPPRPELKIRYTQLLEEFASYRGSSLYYPYLSSGLGNGALVELLDGSVKYDFISGIGVHYWGHSHLDLLDAGIEAALSDTVMEGHLQQNQDALELTRLLTQTSRLDCCFLSSSGAMANENGLKIALQKKRPADRLLAFERCFMGRTLTLAQITDKPSFREGLPLCYGIDYVPFFDYRRPEESAAAAVSVLKKHLARYPRRHAAMCFELVQGEGGFYPGSKEFFEALMRILKDQDIPILVDEVQTFGRTSELFAFQAFGLDAYVDIVTIGKLSQACATLYRKEFIPLPGLLSQTFTSSSVAIRAGKTIIQGLLAGEHFGPQGKIQRIHGLFVERLEAIAQRDPSLLQGPYGIGAMIAFTPFKGEIEKTTLFAKDLFEAGVIGFTAGSSPSRLRFLIPIGAITPHDVDQAMAIVEDVLMKRRE